MRDEDAPGLHLPSLKVLDERMLAERVDERDVERRGRHVPHLDVGGDCVRRGRDESALPRER